MNEKTSVSERLPDVGDYIVSHPTGDCLSHFDGRKFIAYGGGFHDAVTHWRILTKEEREIMLI